MNSSLITARRAEQKFPYITLYRVEQQKTGIRYIPIPVFN